MCVVPFLSMLLAGGVLLRMFCRGQRCRTCTQDDSEMVLAWAELFCPPCMCRRAFCSKMNTATDLQKGCLGFVKGVFGTVAGGVEGVSSRKKTHAST